MRLFLSAVKGVMTMKGVSLIDKIKTLLWLIGFGSD